MAISGNGRRRDRSAPADSPVSGSTDWRSIDRNAPEVRRRVGLVFQDPDDQLFCNTVIEDVAFGPLNLGKTASEARRIALDCLDRVDLRGQADRPPHHLSFGERKRVCLAGVLACDPSVLVLDEPSANLDPRGRRRLIQLHQSPAMHQADRNP